MKLANEESCSEYDDAMELHSQSHLDKVKMSLQANEANANEGDASKFLHLSHG